MPILPTYPGVYVEEIPSGVYNIAGVTTASTAFIDFFPQGPMNVPTQINNFTQFQSVFGGLDQRSEASYGAMQYFLNGGQTAWIVRVAAGTPQPSQITILAASASFAAIQTAAVGASGGTGYVDGDVLTIVQAGASGGTVKVTSIGAGGVVTGIALATPGVGYAVATNLATTGGTGTGAQISISAVVQLPTLKITASNPGVWGNNLQYGIDTNTTQPTALFNLVIRRLDSITKPTQVLASEVYRNLSMSAASPNYAIGVVNAASALVQLTDLGLGTGAAGALPPTTGTDVISPVLNPTSTGYTAISDSAHPASDGNAPDATALKAGILLLDRLDPFIFNILCLPGAANLVSGGAPDAANIAAVYAAAASFCDTKRAFLLVDIPAGITTPSVTANNGVGTWQSTLQTNGFNPDSNSAIYFPRLRVPDPLNQGRLRNVGVSGTMAGIYATTDANRGVWKSPAGIDAGVGGASLTYIMNDSDSATLNPLGINGLRNFKTYGNVVWGARTMQGADQLDSQWAYIAVRRTALYIEESLFEGLKWVVFEPNDTPLWAQIRINVTSFMQNLFRQGAFQGASAASAYFVKCDSETTTQTDINSGIVNILVGFAPLKPAEFVVLQIQQMAGQASS
jgi:phage tail sheath protein FI